MKRITKTIPLLFLALPLISGCGKSGPSFSNKGSKVSYEDFLEKYLETQTELSWNKDDDLSSFVLKNKEKTIKEEEVTSKKVTTSTKTKTKTKTVSKFDLSSGIASIKGKTKENKTIKSGNNGKQVIRSVSNHKMSAEPKKNEEEQIEFRNYDHFNKTYSVNLEKFSDLDVYKEYFQNTAKELLQGIFDIIPSISYNDETEENFKFFVKSNKCIFTFFYEKSDSDTDEETGVTTETTYIEKQQVCLAGKKLKAKHYTYTETTTTYNKDNYLYVAGDKTFVSTMKEEETSIKFKKVNLSQTGGESYSLDQKTEFLL